MEKVKNKNGVEIALDELMKFKCHSGDLVINGINFDNGFGDGEFTLYYYCGSCVGYDDDDTHATMIRAGWKLADGVSFKLFDENTGWKYISVQSSDSQLRFVGEVFDRGNLSQSPKALRLYFKNGDACLVKWF